MAAQPSIQNDTTIQSAASVVDEVGRRLCDPVLTACARNSAELMSLMSRRMQAYLQLPAQLCGCRSPQDCLAEEVRFAQTAWAQYVECGARMMSAAGCVAPQAAGAMELWWSAMPLPGPATLAKDHAVAHEGAAGTQHPEPAERSAKTPPRQVA